MNDRSFLLGIFVAALFLCASLVSGRGKPLVDAGRQIVNVKTDRFAGDTRRCHPQEASMTPGRHGNVAERLRDSLNERLRGEGISYNSVFAMANGSRRSCRLSEGSRFARESRPAAATTSAVSRSSAHTSRTLRHVGRGG